MTETVTHDEQHDVMTLDEAAQFLRLSRAAMYKLIKTSDIPAARILDRWRFSRSALSAWIDRQVRKSA